MKRNIKYKGNFVLLLMFIVIVSMFVLLNDRFDDLRSKSTIMISLMSLEFILAFYILHLSKEKHKG